MTIKELQSYKKILILGYGVEGKATHEFLKKHVPDSIVGIADSQTDKNYLQKQREFDLVIKTPGINKALVTKKYTTATNIFFANVKGITIGITGTKGKSTTASLIYEILKSARYKAHLVGNIGNTMLGELEVSNTKKDYFVCELSSYQLDDCRYSPHIAVILNLFPDHINYHKTIKQYYQAKANIVTHSSEKDYYIYNSNFKELASLISRTKATPIAFTSSVGVDLRSSELIGEHNKENIGAVLEVVTLLGISIDIVKQTISHFKTLPHRLQKVGVFKDIIFYDDGASVTPQSTIASLYALQNVDTLFLGGQNRGYDFTELVETIVDTNIRNIVLFPETGALLKKMLQEKKPHAYNFFETDSMRDAVVFAYKYTKSGAICILSSASPSYTLWANFTEKGMEYQKFIKALART